ncbi:MAG TPA: RNA polymerase sigma factor, partial [Mycobacterium sp.]|nr:RNA polymerase sigma factor [Mycobacterium sp.]
ENSETAAGLAALGELEPDQRWHAVRAELLARDGHYVEAIDEMTASLTGPVSDAEADHRQRQIAQWTRRVP